MKHDWETLDLGLSTCLLRCRRCGATTTNAFLAFIRQCDAPEAGTGAGELKGGSPLDNAKTEAPAMHDESYQALLMKNRREARKAYSASQELGDETESQIEAVMFVSADSEQARFLREQGENQEKLEKAFCWGMLCGGAFALAVLMVTLKVLGVV